ncbi:MAG: hypothetical protein ABW352_18800 [Polyangiales bacterium]
MRRIVWTVCLLLACRPSGQSAFGDVLERGGELGKVDVAETKLEVSDSTVTAWGVLEVPDGSRMQATYAGVDAIARAELLKFIRVRVASVMVSVESSDPARNDAYERIVESVSGSLRHAGTTKHAWERVQHPDRVILRVWSRLTVPRADVEALLRTRAVPHGALPN